MRVARCAACHQQIIEVEVPSANHLTIWIDADPSPDGTIIVKDGIGIVCSSNDAGYKHRPHRASCRKRTVPIRPIMESPCANQQKSGAQ